MCQTPCLFQNPSCKKGSPTGHAPLFYRALAILAVGGLFIAPPTGKALAVGLPVIDASNLIQSTITAVESIQQTIKQGQEIRNQIRQYEQMVKQSENMLRNSLAPAAWIWGEGEHALAEIREDLGFFERLREAPSSFNDYLERFRDLNWYRSSPCFSSSGCSEKEFSLFQKRASRSSDAEKNANDAMMRVLEQQRKHLEKDSARLEHLEQQTQNAAGEMEAIGYGNQLAGQQADQLLQIRGLMIAAHNAQAASLAARADKQAREEASGAALREGVFTPSTPQKW